MRQVKVYFKREAAGLLTQHDDGSFTFHYDKLWLENPNKLAISLTMSKTQAVYKSEHLFPFFYNMLPEGTNKETVCRLMRIDKNDYFGLLMHTAQYDTIGAVTIQKINSTE